MLPEIKRKYEYLITEMPWKKENYHLKSVRNFILHFDNLVAGQFQKPVAELLNEYLDLAIEKDFIENDEMKELFHQYIFPIGQIYAARLNFAFVMSGKTVLILLILTFVLYYAASLNYVFYLVTFLIGFLFFLDSQVRSRKHKVYGLGY